MVHIKGTKTLKKKINFELITFYEIIHYLQIKSNPNPEKIEIRYFGVVQSHYYSTPRYDSLRYP